MSRHAMLPTSFAIGLAFALGLATAQAAPRGSGFGAGAIDRGETAGGWSQAAGYNGLNKFRNLNGFNPIVVPPLAPSVEAGQFGRDFTVFKGERPEFHGPE